MSKKTFPTINPCTGDKICDVAEGDKVELLYPKESPPLYTRKRRRTSTLPSNRRKKRSHSGASGERWTRRPGDIL